MRFQQLQESLAENAGVMEQDHEVQMARADCFHAAKNAIELHSLLKSVTERQGLEGWVSEKISLAADYLRTVKEYMEYEMMPKDNAIVLSTPNYDASFDQYMKEDQETGEVATKRSSSSKDLAGRITTPGLNAQAKDMLIRAYGQHPESSNDLAALANVAAGLEDRGRGEIRQINRVNRIQDQEIDSLNQENNTEMQEIMRLKQEINSLERRIGARNQAMPTNTGTQIPKPAPSR